MWPARQTWEMAATVDRRLRKRMNLESKLETRSFANDMLIAASARELGAIILTENTADFSIIASVLDIRFMQAHRFLLKWWHSKQRTIRDKYLFKHERASEQNISASATSSAFIETV